MAGAVLHVGHGYVLGVPHVRLHQRSYAGWLRLTHLDTHGQASRCYQGYDTSLDTVLPHALEALLVGMGGVPLVDERLALCPVVVVNLFVLVAIVFAYLGVLFLAAEVCLKLLDVFVVFGANLDELCSLFLERVYLGREILGALIEEVDNHKAHCHDNQQEHGRRHTAIELAP